MDHADVAMVSEGVRAIRPTERRAWPLGEDRGTAGPEIERDGYRGGYLTRTRW